MDRFTAHLDRAWDLVAKGDTTMALISARRAQDIDIESPEVQNLVGYIHAMDGDVEDALASYKQAMALDEGYLDPILNSAELLVHPAADPIEAIRLLRSVFDLLEGEAAVEAILLEVEAHLNLGSAENAKTRLNDIEDPESLPSCYAVFIGRALYETGDSSGSKGYFEKAVAEDTDIADAWYYLGLIAREEGRQMDSINAFTAALEADEALPGPPWAKHLEPFESLAKQAIAQLAEKEQATLAGTEVVIVPAPTKHQIQNELDPRQVVFAQCNDPNGNTFEKLWIFTRNVSRSGIMPDSAVSELMLMIQNEITQDANEV